MRLRRGGGLLWVSVCVLFALVLTAGESTAGRVRAPSDSRRAEPSRVLGAGGDRPLVLDFGRSLRGVPLRRRQLRSHSPGRLSAIEKMRLDARRLFRASRLSRREAAKKLVVMVDRRLRVDSLRFVEGEGPALLSEAARRREGSCREVAYLLEGLLREVGVAARVRHGRVYRREELLGASRGELPELREHAWVEAKLGKRWQILDPLASESVASLDPISIDLPGRGRPLRGASGSDLIYLYTSEPIRRSGP